MRLPLRVGLALSLALAAGCSKCGKAGGGGAEPVERVLPRGAVAVVVAPSLAGAGQKLRVLEALKVTGFAAQLRGFPDGKAFADALVGELGIDVRSAEALEKAGVDGARPAALAALVTGHVYLALPVKDPRQFHLTLEALSYKRLGAGAAGEQKSGELTVHTFSPHQGEPPKLGYVLAHGFALITDGEGVAKLAGLAAMTPSDALSADPGYAAELARLPAPRDLVAYLPAGTPLLAQAPVTGVAAALSLDASGLTVTAKGKWKAEGEQLAALTTQQTQPLEGYLPRDAFLVGRYAGDPSKLAPFVRAVMGRYLQRAFDEGGFDLKSEVLDQLQPGAVLALSLSERPPMDRGVPSLDIRQTNPFSYAHLSGVAASRTPEKVLPVLERVAQLAPRFGAEMTLRERADGQKALITTWAQGEGVHFAPKGPLVFFASPVQRLDALVKSSGEGGSPVEGLGEEAVSMAVDLSRLSASVRALPESAWGLGGFAIKATTVRWLDATDDLKRVTLSIGAKEQIVTARLQLSFGAAKAP